MSLYELMYLNTELNHMIDERFSIFIALSSAAVVGAYVAGKHLNNVLKWGIVFLYSVTALGFIRGRYIYGQQADRITADILETAAHTNTKLHMLEGLSGYAVGSYSIALTLYFLIAAGVIFFVFYAKARMPD